MAKRTGRLTGRLGLKATRANAMSAALSAADEAGRGDLLAEKCKAVTAGSRKF